MAKIAIPETQAELEELMGDQKRVGELIQNGQLPDVMKAYAAASDKRGELADQMREQIEAVLASQEAIAEQIDRSVNTSLTKFLKDNGVERPNMGPLPEPGTGAQRNAAYNPLAPGVRMNDIGFANIGDFARTVWHKNSRPDQERLAKIRQVMNDYSSVDPAAGGSLIPEVQRAEIMQLALEESIVRSRATVITMSSLTQTMPFVDATTHVGSVFGGMIFYWTPEAGDIVLTNAKFGRVKLEANKLTGGAAVPNELWADAPALSSWLMQALPAGISFYEDLAFLTGAGGGEPLGVLNAGARIVVTKETGQAADTIDAANVLNMYARMLPQSRERAVWLANQTCFAQLMSLSIAIGTAGAPVMLVDFSRGPIPTMLGRPLILTEKVPTLGDESDLNFVDFGMYLVGDRQAVSIETSEHARFLSDETLLRVISRVDGRPWMQSALTPVNGSTLSPFVSLGARA